MFRSAADQSDMCAHILAVEDESAIRDMVSFSLERHGHVVHGVESATQAREVLAEQEINLALVDWMLPCGSGLEFVRVLRKDYLYSNLPIIMLTAKTEEHDITSGLDAGADDYMTKPFSPRELHSRIKALLRRTAGFNEEETISRGNLQLNLGAHRLLAGEHEVNLGHTEFKLLSFLMKHPDRVYSRSQLLDHVWGPGTFIEERTVDVHVLRLRKSLKPFGADTLLETVRGAGYRLSFK
ncbi:MAG: winged helix-turn-helix domain-containing protein [Granulosicoccus sp.]